MPSSLSETPIGAGNIHLIRLSKPTFTLHHRSRRKRLPVGQHTSLSSINIIIKIFLENSTSTIPLGFRPIAFLSRKLSSAQRNYTTLEKELLSIVETLVEYRTVLYGNKNFVFTDHRNLTFNRLSSQRALRWRLLAEEFNITITFRQGASNLAFLAYPCVIQKNLLQSKNWK